MVKHKFIDPSTAAHFHLVHRSQRDPKAADPEAPQRVLAALPETGNQARKSVRGTQSTRAILQEQDLDGFDEAVDDPAEAAAIHALDGMTELGLPAGYDYDQHMRPIGQMGGQFIAAPASVASLARSAKSRLSQGTRHTAMTQASARSKRGELLLREDMPGAFASVEEEEVALLTIWLCLLYGSTYHDSTHHGSAYHGSAVYGSACYGYACCGSTYCGSACYGYACYGSTHSSSTPHLGRGRGRRGRPDGGGQGGGAGGGGGGGGGARGGRVGPDEGALGRGRRERGRHG